MQDTKVKKYNKGITLVALVITIIILLILAAVGIGAIAGEDGLLSKAKQSAEEYNQAARNEANTINDLLNILNGGEAETPVIDAEGNVQFTYNPSTPTNGSVTVGITTKTEYDIQYRIGDTEGEFEAYTGEIKVDENTAIYVKLANSSGVTGGVATGNVQNIDKEAPIITSVSSNWVDSVTIKATDSGSKGTAASNIGIIGYGINQSSTTAPTFTTCPATTSLDQTITGITTSGTYYVWVKDRAGNTAKREVTVNVDTTAPTTAGLEFYYPMVESDNLNPDGFKIKVTGVDEESGVASYKVYIDGSLYTTETTTEETCIINVTGLEEETSYSCYVVVTNGVGLTKQSETIEIKTIASTATIEKINNYPLGYYGKEVTYTPTNGATEEWKIFYTDSENIYLIASDYVAFKYAPNAPNGNAPETSYSEYGGFLSNIQSSYEGSVDILTEDERVKKWISHINSYTSTRDNMKETAYLLDTSIWSEFKDANNKAEYVVGGPTLELFISSYNDTHETGINCQTNGSTGYRVKWSIDESYGYIIDGLDTLESLYINDSTNEKAYGYWLASPSCTWYGVNENNYATFTVWRSGRIGYRQQATGFRPIICLKSGIQLIEQENGKYAIN